MIGQMFTRKRWEGMAGRLLGRSHAEVQAVIGYAGDCTTWSKQQWADFWKDSRAQAVPQLQGGQLLSVVPSSYFTTPDWTQFATELKGVQEVVRWTLYSYKAYPAAGSINLLFFDQSEGTATAGRLDTNMTTPGQLSGNEMMVVVGISVDPIPSATDVFAVNAANGLAAQQWYTVLTQAWLEVKVSGKEYLVIAPLTQLPPGHGFGTVFSSSQLAANVMNMGHLQSGTPDNRSKYNLDPPFGLLPTRPFEARLRANALNTVTTAGRIGVNYNGWKVRAVL